MPESLDGTYERILKEIKKPNRNVARRVLQCLVVAARSLRVAELAEVLAVDFDDAEGIPRLKSDWGWEEQELALLSACSSLIAIVKAGDVKASDSNSDAEARDSTSGVEASDGDDDVEASQCRLEAEANDGDSHIDASNSNSMVDASDSNLDIMASHSPFMVDVSDCDLDIKASHSDLETDTDDGNLRVEAGDSRIVQFSHFSVKEFLTSSRLASASGEVSNYHIDSEPAHTILAQACLGVLLQIQHDVEGCTPEDHPLARYAAEHWTTHAQIGDVSSRLRKGVECLFDANRSHFEVWVALCDIDTMPNSDATFYHFAPYPKSPAAPLYYAALCGFYDLVERLITKHPQDVNADVGYYMRPLVAALAGEHFRTADLLRHNGADLDVRGQDGTNPLHAAAYSGNLKVVRILIEYNPTDINARDEEMCTPLIWASSRDNLKDGSVHQLLLEHGADINMQNRFGGTSLYYASYYGALEVVRLLLDHSADVEVKDNDGQTALQIAAEEGRDEVVKLLREYGAK